MAPHFVGNKSQRRTEMAVTVVSMTAVRSSRSGRPIGTVGDEEKDAGRGRRSERPHIFVRLLRHCDLQQHNGRTSVALLRFWIFGENILTLLRRFITASRKRSLITSVNESHQSPPSNAPSGERLFRHVDFERALAFAMSYLPSP